MGVKEIRAVLKEKTAVIGLARTLKLLGQGKIKMVFLAANVSDKTKEDIHYYSKLSKIEVEEMKLTNEELGTLCKKPFSISVIGVRA